MVTVAIGYAYNVNQFVNLRPVKYNSIQLIQSVDDNFDNTFQIGMKFNLKHRPYWKTRATIDGDLIILVMDIVEKILRHNC